MRRPDDVRPAGWSRRPRDICPTRICSATSANNSALGCESASTKTSQSPVATAAPEFRARAIWLTGSNTTVAPAARAISAVRSVELLSHTINSTSQPRDVNAPAANLICASDAPSSRSSLKAGITMEIFTAENVLHPLPGFNAVYFRWGAARCAAARRRAQRQATEANVVNFSFQLLQCLSLRAKEDFSTEAISLIFFFSFSHFLLFSSYYLLLFFSYSQFLPKFFSSIKILPFHISFSSSSFSLTSLTFLFSPPSSSIFSTKPSFSSPFPILPFILFFPFTIILISTSTQHPKYNPSSLSSFIKSPFQILLPSLLYTPPALAPDV